MSEFSLIYPTLAATVVVGAWVLIEMTSATKLRREFVRRGPRR